MVLPNTRRERASDVGERMRCAIATAPVEVGGHEIEVRLSAGIAQHYAGSGAAEATEEFIRRADRALYAAKRRGRDRIEVAP